LHISLDIPQAVSTVLGVLPEVKRLREQIVKDLPSFDVVRFDKLEDYAHALNFAHTNFLSATQPPDDLEDVAEEVARMREMLLAEAKALVHRGLVSDAQLGQLKGANGYRNTATDLHVLANVLEGVWPQIEGKTLTTMQDLELASRMATRLLRIVGLRDQGPALVAEATDRRVRAYTLLLVVYDDVRRAVAYLRSSQGDADDIAPALHPGRPRPKKGEAQVPAVTPAENAGQTPTAAGGATAPASSVAAPASNGAVAPAAGGMVVGGPFTS
jgi:hypothetical protein